MNIFILLLLNLTFAVNSKSATKIVIPPADTLEITDSFAKITGTDIIVDVKSIKSITHDIPLIDPKMARTKEEMEWINLTNLEAKWLTGKRYVYIQGKKVEVSLAQEIEILRQQARANAQLTPAPMTQDEKTYLKLRLEDIQKAVDKKLQSDRYENRFRAEMISTTHEANELVSKAVSETNGNIFVLVLDGLPYFLSHTLKYASEPTTHGPRHILSLKSELGLSCNLATTVSSNQNVKLRLRESTEYYADLTFFSYNGEMVIADSVENTAFCDVTGTGGDQIFKNGFDAAQ